MADVQAVVVDTLVFDAAPLMHALHLQRGAMHPATGLVEPLAGFALGALHQPDLAGRRFRCGVYAFDGATGLGGGINAPFAHPQLRIEAGRWSGMDEELGDVETDAAGTDDGDPVTHRLRAGQRIDIADDFLVIVAGDADVTRRHTGGEHDVVEAFGQCRCISTLAEFQVDAGLRETPLEIAQRFVELFLAWNPLGEIELPADAVVLVEQRDLMAAFGSRRGEGKAGRSGADHRDAFG